MDLKEFFEKYDRVAVAFSGGVDSAYLLYEANRFAKSVQPYFVKSQFQPSFELEDAKKLCEELGILLKVIEVDVLSNKTITSNPKDRCYHCKKAIFEKILEEAKSDGFDVIIDGTNASDDISDRPGVKALEEFGVLSPLRLSGLTKDEIRSRSNKLSLFTWDKPSYACLATRIAYNEPITAKRLERTEICEGYLMSLGFSDFRIRSHHDSAKIQVRADQMYLVLENRQNILGKLKEYYKNVALDLEDRK